MKKTKENSQRRPNNNNVVIKSSQGLWGPSQGLLIIFWALSCELSYRYINPHQLLHDGQTVAMIQAATIPRIVLKEMRTNQPWNQRLTVLETIKRTLVRPSMTNLGMTVRADCAVSACSPLPLSIKVLAYWLSVVGSQPLDRCPSFPHLPHLHLLFSH